MTTVSKTLRLSPETIAQIEAWPDDTFTSKFTNMVAFAFVRRAAPEKDIKRLTEQRSRLATDISDLQTITSSIARCHKILNETAWELGRAEPFAKNISGCVSQIAETNNTL